MVFCIALQVIMPLIIILCPEGQYTARFFPLWLGPGHVPSCCTYVAPHLAQLLTDHLSSLRFAALPAEALSRDHFFHAIMAQACSAKLAKFCKILQNFAKFCKICKTLQNFAKFCKICKVLQVLQNMPAP